MTGLSPDHLIIVPARGGSQGVRRKNLRLVNGEPLIACAVRRAFEAAVAIDRGRPSVSGTAPSNRTRIIVAVDDETLRSVAQAAAVTAAMDAVAELGGAWPAPEVSFPARPESPPTETIADLAARYVQDADPDTRVIVLQPTSPTFGGDRVALALRSMEDADATCALTVEAVPHLTWLPDDDGGYVPAGPRLNRQEQAAPVLAETGACQISVALRIRDGVMIDDDAHLIVDGTDRHPDIDTPADLYQARDATSRLKVLFVVDASIEIGSGHVHRCLALADELDRHSVSWAWARSPVEMDTGWAERLVDSAGGFGENIDEMGWVGDYPLHYWDVVVFDKLNTTADEVLAAKQADCAVVCLEDLGEGARYADAVVNALYPGGADGVFSGPRWAVLRPEFAVPHEYEPTVHDRRVLVSFGGTDPARMNEKVSMHLGEELKGWVAAGPAASDPEPVQWNIQGPTVEAMAWDNRRARSRGAFPWVEGGSIVDLMRQSDLVVTSAGRTVYEAACLGVPCVSVPVNEREARHVEVPGVARLPRFTEPLHVARAVYDLMKRPEERASMSATARAHVDALGGQRVAQLIEGAARG